MKKNYIFLLLCTAITFSAYAQLNYIGLKEELTAPRELPYNSLRPEMQLLGDYLYVPTFSGIYKKQLNTTATNWEPYAFAGQPIRDFVKNGDRILAITNKEQDSLMLASNDDGATFNDFTPAHFLEMENFNRMFRIAQNRQNPNSIIVLHFTYGLSKSTDFGESWVNLNDYTGGYQDRFADFHPADSLTINYGGETEFFSSYIQHTADGGQTWSRTDLSDNNCTHFIAAHPTNPDFLLSGSEGRISRSLDRGATWQDPYWIEGYFYIYKILFDINNPSIVYAAGARNGANNTVTIYKSIDEGISWQIAYEETLAQDTGGVADMVQYGNQLILLTYKEGMYALDIDLLKKNKPVYGNFIVYPNPTNGFLEYERPETVKEIVITDMNGRTLRKLAGNKKQSKIDLSGITQGTYLITFYFKEGQVTKKIIIQD
ncbi:T9SS type A sorting domain-containing protein [Flavobacterium sp. Sd200]|uniref:T9SS type A sorting domain-containing protein n=1 Tax=Flavobacterium sp. Sd200 TaxID=2692211 RepID=UPI00136910C7|nr:T9SS type A sorting domain-containing protein [Flavobacterium sp. Sd200]MXN90915.1 T9SS type A sorting domain-containing protein [Flavobacterium sp. Sd200]